MTPSSSSYLAKYRHSTDYMSHLNINLTNPESSPDTSLHKAKVPTSKILSPNGDEEGNASHGSSQRDNEPETFTTGSTWNRAALKTEKQIISWIMLNLENCLLEFNRNKNGDKDQSPEVLMKAANNAIFDLVEVNSKYRWVLTSIQHCYSEVFTKMTLDERKRTKALKN